MYGGASLTASVLALGSLRFEFEERDDEDEGDVSTHADDATTRWAKGSRRSELRYKAP